jgi:hypothetical protein
MRCIYIHHYYEGIMWGSGLVRDEVYSMCGIERYPSPHQNIRNGFQKAYKNLDVVIVLVLVLCWILLLVFLSMDNPARITQQNDIQNLKEGGLK